MPRGLLSGLSHNTWKVYDPRLIAAGNGAVTDPSYGAGETHRGRYLELVPGLVVAQIQIHRGLVGETGVGDCFVVELPVPARKFPQRKFADLDVPHIIGQAMPYKTVTAGPLETFAAVGVADAWASLGGDERRWAQFYIPYILAFGTATWPNGAGNATITITHNLGIAPNASDIEIIDTGNSSPTAAGTSPYIISNITTSTFDLTTGSGGTHGTADATFDYKIRTAPRSGTVGSWLYGPKRPWLPSFDAFFTMVQYEPEGGA